MDTTVRDTPVGCGEIFVEGPVQDVGYIWTQGVTCACVDRVFCDLPVSHAGALQPQRSHMFNTLDTFNYIKIVAFKRHVKDWRIKCLKPFQCIT